MDMEDMDIAFFFCFGLFRIIFGCSGYIETPKHAIQIFKRNSRKQTSCFGQCRNQFRFQFRLYRNETSFVGHLTCGYCSTLASAEQDQPLATLVFGVRVDTKSAIYSQCLLVTNYFRPPFINIYITVSHYLCSCHIFLNVNIPLHVSLSLFSVSFHCMYVSGSVLFISQFFLFFFVFTVIYVSMYIHSLYNFYTYMNTPLSHGSECPVTAFNRAPHP